MKSKEEQIKEMKQILVDYCIAHDICFSFEILRMHAVVLYNAGYRKVEKSKEGE